MDNGGITDLDQRISARVRAQRVALGLTLDELAQHSGVSRAMISRVERGEASPTAVLLGRLANALGMTLSDFFRIEQASSPLVRANDQPVWKDPATGYLRRNVTAETARFDIVDVTLPDGARVTYDNAYHPPFLDQVVWVLAGKLRLMLGADVHDLAAGDSLAMRLDQPISYLNVSAAPVRYAVVLMHPRTKQANP
jgi:transcriptional regulator with XRE-family HTH domain